MAFSRWRNGRRDIDAVRRGPVVATPETFQQHLDDVRVRLPAALGTASHVSALVDLQAELLDAFPRAPVATPRRNLETLLIDEQVVEGHVVFKHRPTYMVPP